MQYPPSWFKHDESAHFNLLLPQPVSHSVNNGQGYQMNPPPAHIGVAEKPSLMRHFCAGHAIQIEEGLTHQKFCPQDDYIRE
jgi:hypothetical protein